MIEARRRDWRRPASDHFRVVTAITFFLMISQTVWEHYLSFLFPLVTYCLAMRPVFGVGFNRVVVAMVLLSIGQNLVIVNAVSNTFELESLPTLLAIGLIKSGPLLGTAVLFTWYRRELLDSYADRAWLAFSTPAPR
jgi:hypothetical protein